MSSVSPAFEETPSTVGAERAAVCLAPTQSLGKSSPAASIELWAHKLRSILTLTLLMLGVFALVVMTSVLDGVLDKVSTGFAGMSWDGTAVDPARRPPRPPRSRSASRCRPGLRYEDLARITASPHPTVARVSAARHEAHVRTRRRRHGAMLGHRS